MINWIDIDTFKNYFKREFKYLKIFNIEETYKKDDIVYYDDCFFISLRNKNKGHLPSSETSITYWEDIEVNYNDYINDEDIEKAINQMKVAINVNLFKNDNELFKIVQLLLTAHFLICDLNMANGGLANYIMTSKSVDGVSASYGIPQRLLNSPYLSYYAKTEFGLKYLQYLSPRLNGYNKIVKGGTSFL